MKLKLSQVVTEIMKTGLSEEAIVEKIKATGVDVTQPTISRIKTGTTKKTSFDIGVALMSLHQELLPKKKAVSVRA